MLALAMVFKDRMVLQRDRKVNIFGNADPGAEVAVAMQGISASAKADADGKFIVEAGPFAVSEAGTMTITSGSEQIVLHDVAVGEVWLAGGQSNMEYYMRYDRELESEKALAPNPDLRFFDYPEVSYVGQVEDADYSEHYGFWRIADAENLQWWNAVPYYFAKDLYAKYQVPIGIIGCNWGGTTASCWTSQESLKKAGCQIFLEEYREQTKNLDWDAYNATFAANPMSFRTNQLTGPGHEIQDWIMAGDYTDDMLPRFSTMLMENLKAQGLDPVALSKMDKSMWTPPMGPKNVHRPGGLYESMLLPLAPYTIRGVIFYQGESDGDIVAYANLYHKTFTALIKEWRRVFGQPEMPFLFVQIASYRKWMMNVGDNYGIVRTAQQWVADHTENTGMAVITDNGMEWDIHPVLKRPVGHRLALLAENLVYGEKDVLCEAPTLTGVTAKEGRLLLTFDNAGEGLHFAEQTQYGEEIPEGTFNGLAIAQDKKEIDMTSCHCTADGSRVIVESDQIRSGVPTEVSIAQDVFYAVNLYNSADLPARPVVL